MSSLDGVFSLRAPRDLLEKLQSEPKRLQAAPNPVGKQAQYAALDFFMTAEHLTDWQSEAIPGTSKAHWRKYADGPLVSHIANGSKHFWVRDRQHTTVRDTKVNNGEFFGGDFFGEDFFGDLVIELENGSTEKVLEVTARVLAHWEATIK